VSTLREHARVAELLVALRRWDAAEEAGRRLVTLHAECGEALPPLERADHLCLLAHALQAPGVFNDDEVFELYHSALRLREEVRARVP